MSWTLLDKIMPNNQTLLGKKCNKLIFIRFLITLLSFFWKVDVYNLILFCKYFFIINNILHYLSFLRLFENIKLMNKKTLFRNKLN